MQAKWNGKDWTSERLFIQNLKLKTLDEPKKAVETSSIGIKAQETKTKSYDSTGMSITRSHKTSLHRVIHWGECSGL